MAEVTLDRVTKQFGPVTAVHEFNLHIKDAEFVVFVGPSGCGKSTTLRMLAGLEEITSGDVAIDGRQVNNVHPKNRDIAMVFQNYALYPHLNVFDNISFGLRAQKLPADEVRARTEEAADILGLTELLKRRPAELSGGQKQRVAMGRAIVRKPKVFLFDEPLSNLDAKLRVEMRNEIKKLHHNLNATMVYVTHDQIEAMTLATKIVVLKDGLVQQIGTPAEIYLRPANLFVADFMGSPAMNLVTAQTRKNGRGTELVIERPSGEPLRLLDKKARNLPDRVVLGIRPEDITEAAFGSGKNVHITACDVDVVEPAGADTFVLLSLSGKEVTARLKAETRAAAGESMDFAFNMEKASYFDVESGERIN